MKSVFVYLIVALMVCTAACTRSERTGETPSKPVAPAAEIPAAKTAEEPLAATGQTAAETTSPPAESVAPAPPVIEVRVPITRDVWISSYNEEAAMSMGRTDRIKLKGRDEFALMDFDTKELEGRQVQRAFLYCANADMSKEVTRLGLGDRSDCLRHIGVSTITAFWEEGQNAEVYAIDKDGGASCDEASTGRRAWAWQGSKVFDVIMGRGHGAGSIRERETLADGWWRVEIDPAVIDLVIARKADGVCVMDMTGAAGGNAANNFIWSREKKGSEPYLVVEALDMPSANPGDVEILSCGPADRGSSIYGSLQLTVKAPENSLTYAVTIDGQPAPLWQVPLAAPAGTVQEILFTDLEPDREYTLAVAAMTRSGVATEDITVKGRSSALLAAPEAPALSFNPSAGTLASPDNAVQVYAVPALAKVDPLTGLADGKDIAAANAVWNGAEGTVRLAAARGDIASVQLVIGAPQGATGITLAATAEAGAAVIPADSLRLFRTWYVNTAKEDAPPVWQAEYAVPFTGGLNIPDEANGVTGQKFQTVSVDLIVPAEADPGVYTNTLTIKAGATVIGIPLRLEVHRAVIPAAMTFNPELNAYGIPFGEGEPYRAAHRVAHYNRCTLNTLPYNQSANVRGPFNVPLEGAGKDLRVTDWGAFDREIGPILDGSLFADLPRAGVPVKTFYLPFCEGYPARIDKHSTFNMPREGKTFEVAFYLNAPPIEAMIDRAYKDALIKATEEYVAHFEEKGYTRTLVQMYLNNKPKPNNITWWTLDEPRWWLDFVAIDFHNRLFKQGLKANRSGNFKFRGDISRPHWQFDFCDAMDMIYTNSRALHMARTVQTLTARNNMINYIYGSCNAVDKPNTNTAAWCLKAWIMGADGVLPWNAISGEGALKKADTNGLLVPGKAFGEEVVASYRVQALREGGQLCELLNLLCAQRKITREQAGLLAGRFVQLNSEFNQAFDDEASGENFEGLDAQAFVRLRETLLLMLDAD